MADDYNAESILSVGVTGEEAINRLSTAFRNLQAAATQTQEAVTAAGQAADRAQRRGGRQPAEDPAAARTWGESIGNLLGVGIRQSVGGVFNALKVVGGTAGRAVAA